MKLLIVTGASAGIGLAAAETFRNADFQVVNLSRRPCPADGVRSIACDLADPSSRAALAAELGELLGSADSICLIHNAARLDNDKVGETDSDTLRAIYELNLIAPNTLNNLAIPHMRTGSSILYVGSTLSEKAVPNSFSYVTSKHATIGMMRATCRDLAGGTIHTACVCPGFTDTEMLREHVPADAMSAVAAISAFGRLIEPQEIADLLLFAANNPVINGAVLHANLGQVES
ncbi:MAG: SDR family oxidoreductase [Pseudomonadota bacterium]